MGAVQVYIESNWNLICADYFQDIHAGIACRELGYEGGRIFSEANFGDLMYRISGIFFNCTGIEDSLMNCNRTTVWYCPSNRYATVICDGKGMNNTIGENSVHRYDIKVEVGL